MNITWKLDTERGNSNEYYAFLIAEDGGWYRASVKFDGCMEFERAFNTPFPLQKGDDARELVDRIHICDIDETIALLQSLKVAAAKHFGEWWPT